MSSSRKLRLKHNYKNFGDTCKNCRHFKSELNYQGVEGIFADTCHVDADWYSPDQDVYILHTPWGVCDKHERVPVRKKE